PSRTRHRRDRDHADQRGSPRARRKQGRRIAIYGAGGVAGYFGGQLALAGAGGRFIAPFRPWRAGRKGSTLMDRAGRITSFRCCPRLRGVVIALSLRHSAGVRKPWAPFGPAPTEPPRNSMIMRRPPVSGARPERPVGEGGSQP